MFLRVLIMWFYNGSGRSVLIVALFHSAFNMTNGQKITPELFHLPEGLASSIPSVTVMMLAMVLAVFTRGRLSYEPERAAARRPAEAGEWQPNYACNNHLLRSAVRGVQAHGAPRWSKL